jgi:hypothetical protein
MIAGVDRFLAEAARHELAAREKRYPRMVEEGAIERGAAAADLAAWRAIAEIFAEGSTRSDLGWPELEHAAAGAMARLAEIEAAPARRDAVQAIHARLAATRTLIDELNAALRRHATRQAA